MGTWRKRTYPPSKRAVEPFQLQLKPTLANAHVTIHHYNSKCHIQLHLAASSVMLLSLPLWSISDAADCNNESVCIMKGDMALHMLLDSLVKNVTISSKSRTLLSLWIVEMIRALA